MKYCAYYYHLNFGKGKKIQFKPHNLCDTMTRIGLEDKRRMYLFVIHKSFCFIWYNLYHAKSSIYCNNLFVITM